MRLNGLAQFRVQIPKGSWLMSHEEVVWLSPRSPFSQLKIVRREQIPCRLPPYVILISGLSWSIQPRLLVQLVLVVVGSVCRSEKISASSASSSSSFRVQNLQTRLHCVHLKQLFQSTCMWNWNQSHERCFIPFSHRRVHLYQLRLFYLLSTGLLAFLQILSWCKIIGENEHYVSHRHHSADLPGTRLVKGAAFFP